MITQRTLGRASLIACYAFVSALAAASPAQALDEIPAYMVTEIGSELIATYSGTTYSTALAVNEDNDAVGWVLVDGGMRAFVYTAESGAALLPLIGADTANQAVDISDRDAAGEVMIVGATKNGTYDEPGRAALWIYDTASGTVTESREIGALDGFASSLATAVSPNGRTVVGYSTGSFLGSPAMIYDVGLDQLEPLDGFPAAANDVNDAGEITGGNFVRAAGGTVTDLGAPAEHGTPVLVAINELGWTAGRASTFHSDGAGRIVVAAVRHTLDWQVLWEYSAFDTAHDINIHGDVVGALGISAAVRPALHIDALGQTFLIESLLGPGYRDRSVTSASGINDAGAIAGSGTGGAVLLTSTGPMPTPAAPSGLTAVPHEPTWQQPWNAITLNWTDSDDLETGFYVERSPAGAGSWTVIKADWINTQLWDMDVGLGATYDYRVRAKGIGGFSDYSNIATATAPSDAVDTTPPTVTILAPGDGAEVSGNISIEFEATDNQALNYVEVSTTVNSSTVRLCSYSPGGATSFSGTCTWRTRKVAPGTYPIHLYASDALTGWATDQISVTLVEDGGGGGGNGGGGGGGGGCHPKKGC